MTEEEFRSTIKQLRDLCDDLDEWIQPEQQQPDYQLELSFCDGLSVSLWDSEAEDSTDLRREPLLKLTKEYFKSYPTDEDSERDYPEAIRILGEVQAMFQKQLNQWLKSNHK